VVEDDDDDDDEFVDSPPRAAPSPAILSESSTDLCLAFDPQIGFALIALHKPRGDQPRVDPGGHVHWKVNVGEWLGHYFLGGHLVVHSRRAWRLLRPDSGQEVAVDSKGDA
jgi:hypothetical protein